MSVLDRIEEKMQDFDARGKEILMMRREVGYLKKKAEKDREYERLRALQDTELEIDQTFRDWNAARDKVVFVVNMVNKMPGVSWQPLGALPVVVVGTLAVAAGMALTAMTIVINRTIQMRMQLNGIKDGWLSPEEAQELARASGTGFGSLFAGAGIGGLIAAGLAIWLLPQMLAKRG